ncbi:DUF6134 family protein [Terasakiella pusilla]|uniref:DUF6134 family protein n=1 Tax=Terasakiella pusilla TaxID=64973 RepID=UPI003AA972AC
MNVLKTILFLISITVPCLTGQAQASEQDLSFDVLRNGEKIGMHQIIFEKHGADLNVSIQTDVEVKIMFVAVYKFHHKSMETWKNGQLVGLYSKTNDDGTLHQLSLARQNNVLSGTSDGKEISITRDILPASLWHPKIINSLSLLNTLEGHEMKIAVHHIGQEIMTTDKGTQPADYYKLTGELERELWFDKDQRLIKVRFKGSDDSEITYKLI